ncbi:50S ribosomal protein L9 [Coxiella endosymbiont of Amblyomma nuttalli]|uniref:50S ribosomal protein L9 n=1 Tax=Coxiella endosymbiont of Amblyomma nuttalli TaxID=2749996 RepID=UPI001BA7E27F|nr:50S ribosomal protein L9 [Coxiella endosymbiont of Amblyomma nuttalli]QTS84079.1 50S ribosomal protein L9 [Coxiella endosymbiont of Amblyomma nuttalli]
MKVILQEKVSNLGNIGDQVVVKPGYARNFLLPYGKAVLATSESIAKFEKHRAALEKAAAESLETAKARAKELTAKAFKIITNATEEGKLFGSVGPREIAEAISKNGFNVKKREVDLSEEPIRQVGEYDISLRLHTDVSAIVKIAVVAK